MRRRRGVEPEEIYGISIALNGTRFNPQDHGQTWNLSRMPNYYPCKISFHLGKLLLWTYHAGCKFPFCCFVVLILLIFWVFRNWTLSLVRLCLPVTTRIIPESTFCWSPVTWASIKDRWRQAHCHVTLLLEATHGRRVLSKPPVAIWGSDLQFLSTSGPFCDWSLSSLSLVRLCLPVTTRIIIESTFCWSVVPWASIKDHWRQVHCHVTLSLAATHGRRVLSKPPGGHLGFGPVIPQYQPALLLLNRFLSFFLFLCILPPCNNSHYSR